MPVVLLVGIWAIVIILGPFTAIWALNTLFHLGIAYTFKTWLSILILSAMITGKSPVSLSNEK